MSTAPYPWLEPTWRSLLGRLATDRMPHALMLTGRRGVGKLALARALAGAALCNRPGEQGDPCGHCPSCRLHAADTHPDLVYVTIPEDRTRILVDQIRELAETMGLSRSVGAHRVAVLWPAEAMNDHAANSLLKTLEEPPEGTVMILVTSQPSRLPATIRSRCQLVTVPFPDEDAARAWLALQGVAEADLGTLLCLSRGAPLTALALAEDDAVTRWRGLVDDIGELVRGRRGVVQAAERWKAMEAGEVIRWIQIALWESARHLATGLPYSAAAEDLQPLAKTLDLDRVYQLQDHLTEWRRLAGTTVNQQLLLEEVFAGMLAPGP